MSNDDRLAQIKVRYSEGWPSSNSRLADIGWLIAQIDRLDVDRESWFADAAVAFAELRENAVAEVKRLRAESERDAKILAAFQAGSVKQTDAILALRALVSWIDGALVDETPHMEIRAAINRYWESLK